MSEIERQWYWDRRSNKAFNPVDVGDGTVRLVSVWHRDEVEGAPDAGARVHPDRDVRDYVRGIRQQRHRSRAG